MRGAEEAPILTIETLRPESVFAALTTQPILTPAHVQAELPTRAAKVPPAIPARLIIIALDILRMCRPPIVEHFFGVSDDRSDRASHTLRIPTLTGNTFVRLRRKEHRQSL